MGKKSKKKSKSKASSSATSPASASAAAAAPPTPSPAAARSSVSSSGNPTLPAVAPMFAGLGGMTPTAMPAFAFGGLNGEATSPDLSGAARLFGGAGTSTNISSTPNTGNTNINSANHTKSSAKSKRSIAKSSPTQVDEVPTPPTPTAPAVDPSVLPELIDGSTSEDAKECNTDDDDEASLTTKDDEAAKKEDDDEDNDGDTPTKAPPKDQEYDKMINKADPKFQFDATSPSSLANSFEDASTNDDDEEGTDGDDEDDSDEEEIDHVSHASMPSLIDGAASDPDGESDDDETWGSIHASDAANDAKEGDDGEEEKTDLGGAFAPFGTAGTEGIHRGPMDDLQKMLSSRSRMQQASVDGLSMGASIATATSGTAHAEPPQVTDDEAEGKAANSGSAKKKKKSKNRKKKSKSGNANANKPACPVTDAIKGGQPPSVIEDLLASRDVDALSFRSQISGHTLLQVAAMAGKIDVMEWCVKVKNADPRFTGSNGRALEDLASTQPAKSKARSLTKWYHVELEKRAEERRRLEMASAIRIQYCAKTFLAKSKLCQLRDARPLGPWAKVVDRMLAYEVEASLKLGKDEFPKDFGKGWNQLKNELDLVVQDKEELDVVGDAAMDLPADAVEEYAATPAENATVEVAKALLTPDAMGWVKKQNDDTRVLFVERIKRLMIGDRTNVRSELRKGTKAKFNMVAKFNKRERIICAIRNDALMVWYVCPTGMVKRRLEDVGRSYDRVLENDRAVGPDPNAEVSSRPTSPTFSDSGSRPTSPTFGGSSCPTSPLPTTGDEDAHDSDVEDIEPEMLVDPSSNVPLKLHEVNECDLDNFKVDANFTPTVKLTKAEEAIVKKGGTVLLLGRSGTGKTLCVANRMLYDSQMYGSDNNEQLFVARTQRLCTYVRGIFRSGDGSRENVQFLSAANFATKLDEAVSPAGGVSSAMNPVVDFRVFRGVIWNEIKGNEKVLDDLQIWTQIRSFIKGSWDAAVGGPLSKEDYLDLPRERCRLAKEKREDAYAIFSRYKVYLEEKGWQDSMDKTSELIQKVMQTKDLKLFDRIYVDEVQDITQAEIGLLFLATGREYDNLFLAGDPAQAVSQGVDFRFEEIRTLVYKMSGGKHKVERWEKLYRNFRSHEGILRVSNLILDSLHSAFPGAAVKLPFDLGLTVGPRPGLLQSSIEDLARLIKANERLRILTRDEHKAKLCDELSAYAPDAKNNVWGIVEAKGLEFNDCVVVDFFSALPGQSLQKAWKNLMLNPQSVAVTSRKGRGSESDLPLAMELELKLFYTGITRACNRLFVIETKPSQAFDAFSRALQNKTLGDAMTPDAVVKEGAKIMTADDWRKEAFDMASLAEENDIDSANFLERAIAAMEKAGDDDLANKAKLHLAAVQNETDATIALMKNEADYEELAVASLVAYIEAGLTAEASRACGVLCRTPDLKGLARRIQNLGETVLGVKED